MQKLILASLTIFLLSAGCAKPYENPYGFKKLNVETEQEVLKLVKAMRSTNYLTRATAANLLRARIVARLPGGPVVVPYIVPLLNSSQWDVRAEAIKILIDYGRFSPSAIAGLIEVLADNNIAELLRSRIVESLRGWTGNNFGYNAAGSLSSQKIAVQEWRKWLAKTEGVFRVESAEGFKQPPHNSK